MEIIEPYQTSPAPAATAATAMVAHAAVASGASIYEG
jgi:hypothetical protein